MLATSKKGAGAAASLLLVTLIAGCATVQPKAAGQTQFEELTAERIYAALNADPVYYFRHVDVRVEGTVAYLSGYIWSAPALYRAKSIAAHVPGVTDVVNYMELERQGTRGGGHTGSG